MTSSLREPHNHCFLFSQHLTKRLDLILRNWLTKTFEVSSGTGLLTPPFPIIKILTLSKSADGHSCTLNYRPALLEGYNMARRLSRFSFHRAAASWITRSNDAGRHTDNDSVVRYIPRYDRTLLRHEQNGLCDYRRRALRHVSRLRPHHKSQHCTEYHFQESRAQSPQRGDACDRARGYERHQLFGRRCR